MQGEQMDNMDELIRAASESHHPAYDDKSWEMMEAMLDKHLPLKKDRRRPFIFFLLLFFVAGALFMFLNNRPTRQPGTIAAVPPVAEHLPNKSANLVARATDAGTQPLTSEQKVASPTKKTLISEAHPLNNEAKLSWKRGMKNASLAMANVQAADKAVQNKSFLPLQSAGVDKDQNPAPVLQVDNATGPQKDATANKIGKKDSTGSTPASVPDAAQKQPRQQPAPAAPAAKVVKKGFANNFGLYVSAGPDLSFVGFRSESRSRLNYGAGINYQVAKKITVRTGFFVAKKTYSANGGDYHPPPSYWTNNADLKNVYADCKIYEIPLSAYYNFKETANQSWFAGVGLSTFLMKRETYDYYYKDAWGQALNKTWTLKNGGNQYFSVLTISGGYQYKVTSWFSLLAEPYFKLPLQGIGFGKIKLNSGGLLFTASVKPFAGKK